MSTPMNCSFIYLNVEPYDGNERLEVSAKTLSALLKESLLPAESTNSSAEESKGKLDQIHYLFEYLKLYFTIYSIVSFNSFIDTRN